MNIQKLKIITVKDENLASRCKIKSNLSQCVPNYNLKEVKTVTLC